VATPARRIAKALGRTPQAVRVKCCELGIKVEAAERGEPACAAASASVGQAQGCRRTSMSRTPSPSARSDHGWKAIGAALAVGKAHALRVTGANAAWGRNYSREFSQWMKAHGFHKMTPSVRSHAIELNIKPIAFAMQSGKHKRHGGGL
jgi:hypothetical protein